MSSNAGREEQVVSSNVTPGPQLQRPWFRGGFWRFPSLFATRSWRTSEQHRICSTRPLFRRSSIFRLLKGEEPPATRNRDATWRLEGDIWTPLPRALKDDRASHLTRGDLCSWTAYGFSRWLRPCYHRCRRQSLPRCQNRT